MHEHLLKIHDQTQQRIARDLHDDAGQVLTGLGLKAATLMETINSDDSPVAKLAAEVMQGVERARGCGSCTTVPVSWAEP